ncbi:MAG: sigma-70 family RNA polymerase sigma factor [Sphingomonadaceae bacterium]|nr:sigma-70 family RNA polymerase sigma factor [Sphingomonadaceae bacterium]
MNTAFVSANMMQQAVRQTEENDDELVARIAARDHAAMRLAADRHAAMVWRVAYRMLGERAEAEDVAQESLLKLWNHADRWKAGGSGIAPWLKKVTVNQCLDRLRRKRFTSDEEVPEREDESPLADRQMETTEVGQAVKDCIEALPDRQRAAVILTYYEEQPNQGAAESLEMQLKAFESLLFRARASLKDCVERKGVAGVS